MKKTLYSLAVMALISSANAFADEKPIISLHSTCQTGFDITLGLGATENTYVEVDCGFGRTETLVTPAVFNSATSSVSPTYITCTMSPSGTVDIYGDAELIDYVDFSYCYIDRLDVSALSNLDIIDLNHNELIELDLTPNTKLESINVSYNQFTGTFTVGPKPDLVIFNASNSAGLDPDFDMTLYPKLTSFDCWNNLSLTKLDPTKCPNLMQLSIDLSNVETLDVSRNPYLSVLNISDTKITSIDLTQNPNLQQFYNTHYGAYNTEYKMSSLDVSANPLLTVLFASGNLLTNIDVSNNTKLTDLYVAKNCLKNVDITNCPNIVNLDVRFNNLGFANLPDPRSNFISYLYEQNPVETAKSYKEGTVLDYTDLVMRDGTITTALLRAVPDSDTGEEAYDLDEDYYTFSKGVVTLHKACPDSVYIAFSNSRFNEYNMQTSKFMIKTEEEYGKPNPAVTFNTLASVSTINLSVGVAGATASAPKEFFVDFGDGKLVSFNATTNTIPEAANVTGTRAGTTCTIYLPDEDALTALAIDGITLTEINVTKASSLQYLRLNSTRLTAINLDYNRCLRSLDLSDNYLTSVDLTPDFLNYDKYVLTDINLSNNRIKTLELNDAGAWRVLDLSNNQLTEISLERAMKLTDLNLSNNQISEILLNDCEALINLDLSNNNLSSIVLFEEYPLQTLNLSGNHFTLPSLPAADAVENFTYAPQQTVVIPVKSPAINLTSEYLDVDGQTTQYKWFTADGTEMTAEQIKDKGDGRFSFLDTEAGLVYCEMTHPLYPQFNGENVIKTTQVETAAMPTHVAATFTTLEDGIGSVTMTGAEENTTVLIDWTGDEDVEVYQLGTTYTVFPAQVYKNAKARVLTYEEDDKLSVFSLSAGPLADIDASPMKGLFGFMVYGSGLSEENIKLPESDLGELCFTNANLSNMKFNQYENLVMLNLSGNKYETYDVSDIPSLQLFYMANNNLTGIKLDNPKLWNLDLSGNNLSDIDLSALPQLEQLFLSHNLFEELDVEGLSRLRAMYLTNNYFNFTTLPEVKGQYVVYEYGGQAPIDVEIEDDKRVDLGWLSDVNGTSTVYRWFHDTPYYDEEGNLIGEELEEGVDYEVVSGVFTFLKRWENIMCVMTNDLFPKLTALTDFMDITLGDDSVDEASLSNVSITSADGIITVRGAEGNVTLFGIDGTVIGAGEGEEVTFGPLADGIYVVRTASEAAKIRI